VAYKRYAYVRTGIAKWVQLQATDCQSRDWEEEEEEEEGIRIPPGARILHSYRRENLKSYNNSFTFQSVDSA
jgi:hypothetical protein